jgi:hypothetical protein
MADLPALHDPASVTADWLQRALGRRVLSFNRTDATSVWGAHVRIVAEVDGEPAPLKLRVKIASATVFGRGEVDYYLRDFVDLPGAPLVRCHHAAAGDAHYHLLLDDLADTHRNQDEFPVTGDYGRGLVESLARLQAHRWTANPPDAAAVEEGLAWPLQGLPVMLDAMEQGFSAADRARVADVFERLPEALARRAADPAGFAWTHGDLNPGNILAPIQGPGPVLLIDYQPFGGSPGHDQLAINDLAHAMVLWWPEASRREWAAPLVAHWHEQLCSLGVGYASADRLQDDWRLCVARTLLTPASRCAEAGAVTAHRGLWTLHVRRALAALAELG